MFIPRIPSCNYIQKYTTSDDSDISYNLLPFFTIITAYERKSRGIGYQNRIPWHVPEDMNFFRKTTIRTQDPNKKNVVIMGKNTWESIKKKPLDKRINICLTTSIKKKDIGQRAESLPTTNLVGDPSLRQAELAKAQLLQASLADRRSPDKFGHEQPDMFFAYSMNDALQYIQNNISGIESVFIIGGSQLYQEAIQHPQCKSILINELIFEPNILLVTDSFFPEIPENMYQEINLTENPIQSDTSVQIYPRKFIRKHI